MAERKQYLDRSAADDDLGGALLAECGVGDDFDFTLEIVQHSTWSLS